MVVVAAVLAVTSPWDAGREGGGGPKEQFLSQVEGEMDAYGIPDSVADCLVDGLDGELTDADAQLFPTVGPSVSRAEAEADPARRAVAEKLADVNIGCSEQMAEAWGDDVAAEAATFVESLR